MGVKMEDWNPCPNVPYKFKKVGDREFLGTVGTTTVRLKAFHMLWCAWDESTGEQLVFDLPKKGQAIAELQWLLGDS